MSTFVYVGNFPLFKIKINIYIFYSIGCTHLQNTGHLHLLQKGGDVSIGKELSSFNLPVFVGKKAN